MNIFLKKYLNRLEIKSTPFQTLDFLKRLHKQHLLNIPFENLNIYYGLKIELSKNSFEKKILDKKRGGFCYELNGAFSFLLEEIGFERTFLSARVINEKGIAGAEFDHLALLVKIQNVNYLVDVGFGEAFLEPLKFEIGKTQTQFGRAFKIIQVDDKNYKLLKSDDCENFTDKYLFSLTPRKLSDFEEMCKFHQTSPNSTFTQKLICTKATPTGRMSLTNSKFIETQNGLKTEMEIKNEIEIKNYLKQKFEIEINEQ